MKTLPVAIVAAIMSVFGAHDITTKNAPPATPRRRNPLAKLRNDFLECQVSVSVPYCAVRRNDRGSSRGPRRALRTALLALPRESAKSRTVALMIARELIKEIVKRDASYNVH